MRMAASAPRWPGTAVILVIKPYTAPPLLPSPHAALPELPLGRSGENRGPHLVDGRQARRRGAAPFECGRGRSPVKQRGMPRVGDTAALVVDEAVISRAPRPGQ